MVKNEIGREALKYNFLKKIIIRFDYDGMDDTELDQVLSDVSLKLKEHGYTNRTIETATEMQIQFDDPESGNYSEVYGKKVREQKVFVFHNENPQVKLGISSSSACINIEETKYVDCLIYCDVLWKVMKIISESGKVPFFEFKRFGLRKINQCFLRDIKCLNKYFEPAHFHVFKFQDESSVAYLSAKDKGAAHGKHGGEIVKKSTVFFQKIAEITGTWQERDKFSTKNTFTDWTFLKSWCKICFSKW